MERKNTIKGNRMKDLWKKYASKIGKIKENYLKKHKNRNEVGKAAETSCCHCDAESGKVEEEKIERDAQMKGSTKKKVVNHLNEDIKNYKKEIKEDKKLKKSLKNKKKTK